MKEINKAESKPESNELTPNQIEQRISANLRLLNDRYGSMFKKLNQETKDEWMDVVNWVGRDEDREKVRRILESFLERLKRKTNQEKNDGE